LVVFGLLEYLDVNTDTRIPVMITRPA
jgi:hypothetical protein